MAMCYEVQPLDAPARVVLQSELVTNERGPSASTDPRASAALEAPLLSDAFHANRWDYWFYNAKSGKEVERNKITVLFENDKVVKVDGTAPVAIKGEERK